jgi:hypothetical protein
MASCLRSSQRLPAATNQAEIEAFKSEDFPAQTQRNGLTVKKLAQIKQ